MICKTRYFCQRTYYIADIVKMCTLYFLFFFPQSYTLYCVSVLLCTVHCMYNIALCTECLSVCIVVYCALYEQQCTVYWVSVCMYNGVLWTLCTVVYFVLGVRLMYSSVLCTLCTIVHFVLCARLYVQWYTVKCMYSSALCSRCPSVCTVVYCVRNVSLCDNAALGIR